MRSFFPESKNEESPRGGAIFLSGSGSNAERIIDEQRANGEDSRWFPVVLVTDAPKTSRARELAEKFGLPLIENDIREFYRCRGKNRISIATEEGARIREEWTDDLRSRLSRFKVNFGVLAGFRPLTNITADFPCLNVHPGDLTYLKDGRRYLVGLHKVPVEKAILEGLSTLRSSVIVAQPYIEGGANMDSGPLLGVSEEVQIDFGGHSLEELREAACSRPNQRPKGGFDDILAETAGKNLEKLKVNGDWIIFPQVIADFAAGYFALDDGGGLLFKLGGKFHPVETVIYGEENKELIFRRRERME